MNLKARIGRAFLFVGLCLLSATGAFWRFGASLAQEYPPSLLELRANSEPQMGEPFVVDIYANIAAPAYGFGLQIKYDPAVLQPELQTEADGSAVPLRIGGPFMSAQRIRNSEAANENGSFIDVVYTLLPPAEPASGEGFIGRVSFTVLQESPTQLELVSPRLISLTDGTAADLPVSAAPALALMQAVSPPETVSQVVPEAPLAAEQPVSVTPVTSSEETLALADNVLASLNTSSDILAQMNRTTTLMNAVLIGLLTMITLLLAVISISSVVDAIEAARTPRMRPAHAYAVSRSARSLPTQRVYAVEDKFTRFRADQSRQKLIQRAQTRRIDTRDL